MDTKSTFGSPVPAGGLTVAIGAASTNSAALTKCSGTIRVVATVDCWIEFAGQAAAAGTGVFIPAFTPEYFEVKPGSTIAVIQSSVGGSLYVTQL